MLLVPFAVGLLPSWGGRASWWHVPMLVAWLAAYLFSYFALLATKTRRVARHANQLRVYGAVAAAAGVPVVVARPEVLRLAPAFAALAVVTVVLARRRDDRNVAGGLASAAQACLVVPAVAAVGRVPMADVAPAAVACFLYLGGTVLYVKTMIRERGERSWFMASVAWHAVALPVAAFVSAWLFVPFTAYLLRAVHLPHRSLTVTRVGLVEVACSLALLGALALPVAGWLAL